MLKNALKQIMNMAVIEKHGDWYIATCPMLSPVGSQGKTKKAAVKNLKNVLQIYINGCFDSIVTEMIQESNTIRL